MYKDDQKVLYFSYFWIISTLNVCISQASRSCVKRQLCKQPERKEYYKTSRPFRSTYYASTMREGQIKGTAQDRRTVAAGSTILCESINQYEILFFLLLLLFFLIQKFEFECVFPVRLSKKAFCTFYRKA